MYLISRFLKRRKHKGRVELLVAWEGLPEDQATWEPRAHLMRFCPEHVLRFEELWSRNHPRGGKTRRGHRGRRRT